MRPKRPDYVPVHSQYVPADGVEPWWMTWFRLGVVLPVLSILVIALALIISAMPPGPRVPGATFHTPDTYGTPAVLGDGSGSCFDVVCTYRAPR